jgi:hypothetical protein
MLDPFTPPCVRDVDQIVRSLDDRGIGVFPGLALQDRCRFPVLTIS